MASRWQWAPWSRCWTSWIQTFSRLVKGLSPSLSLLRYLLQVAPSNQRWSCDWCYTNTSLLVRSQSDYRQWIRLLSSHRGGHYQPVVYLLVLKHTADSRTVRVYVTISWFELSNPGLFSKFVSWFPSLLFLAVWRCPNRCPVASVSP